jgi:hypothetical protein
MPPLPPLPGLAGYGQTATQLLPVSAATDMEDAFAPETTPRLVASPPIAGLVGEPAPQSAHTVLTSFGLSVSYAFSSANWVLGTYSDDAFV